MRTGLADTVVTRKLFLRGTHPETVRFCEKELTNQLMPHAMTESTKPLMERIRAADRKFDREKLAQHMFGTRNSPRSRFINDFSATADESEHFGFRIQLLKGSTDSYVTVEPITHVRGRKKRNKISSTLW